MTIKNRDVRNERDREVQVMKWDNVMQDIQMVIEEQIELDLYELKGSGEPQFFVKMIDGEEIAEDEIILIDLKLKHSFMSASGTYIPIDHSNYIGLLEVYYCKKKKGLFGKESVKVINSIRKPFHRDEFERGEEVKVSLKELMKI